MALWFRLHANAEGIGTFEARRVEGQDLDSPEIDDTVNTYEIRINGHDVGPVRHRYGDGPWVLIGLAMKLAPKQVTEVLARVRADE